MMIAPRLYRLLLRCYPRAFREEFGDEMCATFARVMGDCRTPAARRRLWLATIVDAVSGGIGERVASNRVAGVDNHGRPLSLRMDTTMQDFRFAARSLRRRPGFVGTVVLTLALGIGANTAIFSLIDAVLLHPVPVRDAGAVVTAFHRLNDRVPHEAFPFPLFRSLARDVRSLDGLAGYHVMDIGARIGGRVEQVQIAGVSGNYFDVLGLRPQVGRLLHASDDGPRGANPIVVLSDETWTRFYGKDPGAIGATVHAGGIAYTVVGVAPRGFRGTDLTAAPQLWFPIAMSTSLGEGGLFDGRSAETVFETTAFGWVEVVGRLREGTTHAAAASELNALTLGYWRSLGGRAAAGRDTMAAPVSVLSLASSAALGDRENLLRFVGILSAVVVLTLLIACVNVANLLIIRGTERARELAVRAALGASRSRLTRQALLESSILAVLGAAAAVMVALAAMRLLAAFALPGGIALDQIGLGLNLRVLAFTAGAAAFAAIAFGLLPAHRAGRSGGADALRGHGGNTASGPRGGLVVAQAAISILLLVGAGLFIRSLQAGLTTDLGMDPRGLAAATVDLSIHGYNAERKAAFYSDAVARARTLPGVEAAAIGSHVPLARINRLPMSPLSGADAGDRSARVGVGLVHVSPEYFDVIGVPLRAGRGFTASDDASVPRVAIVNESAARRLAPGLDIIGREIRMLGTIAYTVVGIVADTKYASVRDSAVPVMFTPAAQPTSMAGSLIIRARNPGAVLPELAKLLGEIDPNLPVRDVRLVAQQVNAVLMPQRFGAMLLGALALIALCISTVGIYGVVAYGVSQRARELGIRIALGAGRDHIVRVVALRSAIAIGIGMAIGVGAAGLATRGLEGFLYGVTRLDLIAFAGAIAVLGAAAVFACLAPVRRALGVDPMSVIRSE
jgi:predicted permease